MVLFTKSSISIFCDSSGGEGLGPKTQKLDILVYYAFICDKNQSIRKATQKFIFGNNFEPYFGTTILSKMKKRQTSRNVWSN